MAETAIDRTKGGAKSRGLKSLRDRAIQRALEHGISPLDTMLGAMRYHLRMARLTFDEELREFVAAVTEVDGVKKTAEVDLVSLERAIECAKAAANFCHPRMMTAEVGGKFEGAGGGVDFRGAHITYVLPAPPRLASPLTPDSPNVVTIEQMPEPVTERTASVPPGTRLVKAAAETVIRAATEASEPL